MTRFQDSAVKSQIFNDIILQQRLATAKVNLNMTPLQRLCWQELERSLQVDAKTLAILSCPFSLTMDEDLLRTRNSSRGSPSLVSAYFSRFGQRGNVELVPDRLQSPHSAWALKDFSFLIALGSELTVMRSSEAVTLRWFALRRETTEIRSVGSVWITRWNSPGLCVLLCSSLLSVIHT